MNDDEKWDEFKRNSARIQKASVSEKLDAIAAAINAMHADTSQIPNLSSKIMGDEGAIDTANSMAMDPSAPDAPPDAGGLGDESMNKEDMNAPPVPDDAAGAAPEAPPVGDVPPGAPAPDAPPIGGDAGAGGVPPGLPGGASGEGGEEDDDLSDEDIEALLDEIYGSMGGTGSDEAPPEPAVGDTSPEVPVSGGAGLADAANNLLAALKQAAHEAVDSNDTGKIMELVQLEQQLQQTLGGVTNLTEADSTVGPVDSEGDAGLGDAGILPEDDGAGAEGIGALGSEPGAPIDDLEGASDIGDIGLPPEGDEPEAELAPDANAGEDTSLSNLTRDGKDSADDNSPDDDSEAKPKDESKEDESDDSSDKSDDNKKSDDDKDDKKDVKKSADCDEDEEECDEDHPSELEDFLEDVKKSAIPPTPSFRDMMAGKFDMKYFMKGDREGYIDGDQIFKDPMVDKVDMEGVTDGCGRYLAKSDDRIATARSIFDRELMTGYTDPDSIAQPRGAEAALSQTGTTNPEGISQSEPIMDIRKSSDDDIASSGTAQDALSHTGTTDPESVAQAEPAVSMDGGDESEGETVQKSEDNIAPAMVEPPKPDENSSNIAKGRHIMTLKEMMGSIANSQSRPFAKSSVSGDIARPELTAATEFQKSQNPPVRMGHGVDPMDVIRNDLTEYNLYKARTKF